MTHIAILSTKVVIFCPKKTHQHARNAKPDPKSAFPDPHDFVDQETRVLDQVSLFVGLARRCVRFLIKKRQPLCCESRCAPCFSLCAEKKRANTHETRNLIPKARILIHTLLWIRNRVFWTRLRVSWVWFAAVCDFLSKMTSFVL